MARTNAATPLSNALRYATVRLPDFGSECCLSGADCCCKNRNYTHDAGLENRQIQRAPV